MATTVTEELVTVYCEQLAEWGIWDGGQCCTSCHDEWDRGYSDPLETEVGGVRYRHCCRLLNRFDFAAQAAAARWRAERAEGED